MKTQQLVRQWLPGVAGVMLSLVVLVSGSGQASAQDSRRVTEPKIPKVCTTLRAELMPHDGTLTTAEETRHRDTTRIESALAGCRAGEAVLLSRGAKGEDVYLIGPMKLTPKVTLVVGEGVALWGSRNPRDYDNQPGSCGVVTEQRGPGCKPLLVADHASGSGIMGEGAGAARGAIDGRGGAKLLRADGTDGETWWQLAHRAKVEDENQSVTRILVVRDSNNFTLYNLTLRNSPQTHVSTSHVHGLTIWKVKIDTPKWARNTDGIDPGTDTADITIAHSYIRNGDDNISPKAASEPGTEATALTRMTVYDAHFYDGHGFGIGSQTSGGVSHVRVKDLSIDGSDNGLRIKSDRSRGGLVEDVRFEDVCIRNSPNPIVINPYYTTFTGTEIPVYKGIVLKHVFALTDGTVVVRGIDAEHTSEVEFEDVTVAGLKADDLQLAYSTLTVSGGGNVPLADGQWTPGPDVTVHRTGGVSAAGGSACGGRFPAFPEDTANGKRMATPVSAEVVPPADPAFYVAADGTGDYYSVEAAIRKVPMTGGVVMIAPGTYREQVIIRQSHVTLRSAKADPSRTVIVDDTSQGTRAADPKNIKESYATVHVLGDDFHAENLTFQNDFNRTHEQVFAGSQAQALNLQGDRNVLTNVHILGNQDTLYMGAPGCGESGSRTMPKQSRQQVAGDNGQPCVTRVARSYFDHCLIAGNVDYIYGDGIAVFEDCEIHNTVHAAGGYLTAQGKYKADQQSVFVFDRCTVTAEPGVENVYLGRPWRPYASVVFLNSKLGAHIAPAGWREWHPGETSYLNTVFYAEYQSTGPGANPTARDPHSHQLSPAEAARYSPKAVLAGSDGWDPVQQ